MDKDILKGVKFGFGVILVFSILGLVSAVGFHVASEILPGTFQGNYTFNGSLNVSGVFASKAQVFRVRLSTSYTHGANAWEKLPFDSIVYNTLNGTFDSVNNRFIASRAGYYRVSFSGYSPTSSSNTVNDRYAIGASVNGVLEGFTGSSYSNGDTPLSGYSSIIYLNVGDYVEIHSYSSISAIYAGAGGTTGHECFWYMNYLGS